MSRSFRSRRNRAVNTNEQEQAPFFSKTAQKEPAFFQPKMEINQPGDQYKKEADNVANNVIKEKDKGVQRLSTPKDEEEPATNDARMEVDKEIQEKPEIQQCAACEKEEKEASPALSSKIEDRAGKGKPMPEPLKQSMGAAIGADFSGVNVHTDDHATAMNNALGAQAFTHGNDIYFNQGKYDPGSNQGQHLLAHELTHVVQQGQAPAVSKKQIQRTLFPLVIMEGRRVGSGSVTMGPGITVSWNGNSMSIVAHMEVYGPSATAEIAQQIQDTINRVWNQSFPDGYSVSCQADVTYRAENAAEDSNRTQIHVIREPGVTNVSHSWLIGERYMTFNLFDAKIDWTPAHEFAHLIGLPDHYSEGIVSKIRGRFGGRREATIDEGWQGNIMGQFDGVLESKNIQEWLDRHGVQYVMPGSPDTPQTA